MIQADSRYPAWDEKYRPKDIESCILPKFLKKTFQSFIDAGTLPNLLLHGPSGMGKTTAAKAVAEQLGFNVYFLNASESRNIDTLRVDVRNFCSTRSFDGSRKVVIFDEADNLNPQSTQPSLRGFIEEFASNVSFIFTANVPSKIVPAIQSRCTLIEYSIPKSEKPALAKQFMKRTQAILDAEQVDYELSVLAELILRYFPDFRRTLNELQKYSIANGAINSGILAQVKDIPFEELVKALSEDDFTAMRKWVATNNDVDTIKIMRRLYDTDIFEPKCLPDLVLVLGEYMDRATRALDTEVNLAACLTQVMMSTTVKK